MDLIEILARSSCSAHLHARNKEEVLTRLAELAIHAPAAAGIDAETIRKALADREAQGSTAFGNEIAIPHARLPQFTDFLLFVVTTARGIDFDAIDRKRVRIFFVILGPVDAVNQHLKTLAFVSRALSHTDLKQELLAARTETALYEALVRNTQPDRPATQETRQMKLLLVNLYIDEYLYRVLELFIQEGVAGATIVDSAGMGHYISNVPLFADFIGFMQESKHHSKTILAMVPADRVDTLVAGIEEITGDLDKKQGAVILVLDISLYRGSMKMI